MICHFILNLLGERELYPSLIPCIQDSSTHNHHPTYREFNKFPKFRGVKQENVGSNHKSKEGGKEEEHDEQEIGGWQRDRYNLFVVFVVFSISGRQQGQLSTTCSLPSMQYKSGGSLTRFLLSKNKVQSFSLLFVCADFQRKNG